MKDSDVGRLTFTVEEVARLLGVGRNSAYEAIIRGEVPSIHIGRRVLVPRRELLRLLGYQSGDLDGSGGIESSSHME